MRDNWRDQVVNLLNTCWRHVMDTFFVSLTLCPLTKDLCCGALMFSLFCCKPEQAKKLELSMNRYPMTPCYVMTYPFVSPSTAPLPMNQTRCSGGSNSPGPGWWMAMPYNGWGHRSNLATMSTLCWYSDIFVVQIFKKKKAVTREVKRRGFELSGPDSMLTHLALDKITAISQTIFSDAFSWMTLFCILIKISMKFILTCPIRNNPALVQIMAWCRKDDKPLSEPMLTRTTDAYMWH